MSDETESSLARWLQRASADAAPDPEPADYGTAFGLDMSLLPVDEPGAESSAEPAPNAWLRRLGLPAR